MPRVKIDYVVSFSSEDPEHPANNLLEWEISKKKWLCSKGESSCSVVLQLTNAVKIESVNIGAYHAASLEVLVGLSEKPNDPFEVLVPTSMLLSPPECRGEAVQRVRSFSGGSLAAARERRWDRMRLVCAQPYNKHCQYGLSFVHIYSSEPPAPRAFASALALESLPSDDEDFRPGELFAQHTQRASTGAQIRQASMEAIKNNSEKSTKLLKAPISKPSSSDQRPTDDNDRSNRHKHNIMYTDEDDRPHARIDHVVDRHKKQKDKEQPPKDKKTNRNNEKEKQKVKTSVNKDTSSASTGAERREQSSNTDPHRTEAAEGTSAAGASGRETSQSGRSAHNKRKRSDQSGVLAGVRFTLSGYENPRRGQLRAAALALGAVYLPDYSADCTHLVCAFPNTPKLRAARAAGSAAAAVTGDWLDACARRRRLLPWRWFAVEPRHRQAPPGGWERSDDDRTEEDTDDEIEKFIQQQEKKKRLNPPARAETDPATRHSDTDSTDRRADTDPTTQHSDTDPTDHRADTATTTPRTETATTARRTDTATTTRRIDTATTTRRIDTATTTRLSDPDPTAPRAAPATRDELDDANSSGESDVTFVRDERVRAHVTLVDSDESGDSDDTDRDERAPATEEIDESKVLPNFFESLTFSLAAGLRADERARLARYIRAYGGLVVDAEGSGALSAGADYLVCGGSDAAVRGAGAGAGARRVSPAWVWRCHRLRARAPSA